MNKIKTILVDDEPDGLKTIEMLLKKYCPNVDVICMCSNATDAAFNIAALNPNLVMLDINMPGKNGIEMLNDLKEKKFETIFVTAHNNYMLQALKLTAADYLLKPVDEDRLIEAIQTVEKKLATPENKNSLQPLIHNMQASISPLEMKICIPTIKGFSILKLDEIIYCESEKNYTIFHLLNKAPITVAKTLGEYEDVLSNTFFHRVHKCFLINLNHIEQYHKGEGGSIIMSNGKEVEVSRRKKEEFIEKIKAVYKK